MTGNSLKERAARYAIYSVVGTVTFFLSLNLFMDWELVKHRIVRELERMTGYDVAIGDVSFGFSGIEMEEVVMVSRPDKEGEKPTRFTISTLKIKASPLSLLKGNPDVGFAMETLGGTIGGKYEKSGDNKMFKLELDNIRISKIPFLRSAVSLPMKGRISMDGKVELTRHGWRKANGEFNVTMKSVVVGDGKTKVKAKFLMPPKNKAQANFQKDGFPLAPLHLGPKFSWTVSIVKGKAEIKDFVTKSPDGEIELVGSIKFRDPIKLSMADMYVKFKFSEEAKKKHDSLEVFELSLQRRGKRADGSFGMSISGQLAALRFLPRKTGIIDYQKNRRGRNGLNRSNRQRPKSMRTPRTRIMSMGARSRIRPPRKNKHDIKKFPMKERRFGGKNGVPIVK